MFVCTGNPAICVPNIRNELDKITITNRKIMRKKLRNCGIVVLSFVNA